MYEKVEKDPTKETQAKLIKYIRKLEKEKNILKIKLQITSNSLQMAGNICRWPATLAKSWQHCHTWMATLADGW